MIIIITILSESNSDKTGIHHRRAYKVTNTLSSNQIFLLAALNKLASI